VENKEQLIGQLITQRVALRRQRDQLLETRATYSQRLRRLGRLLAHVGEPTEVLSAFGEDHDGNSCFRFADNTVEPYPDYDQILALIDQLQESREGIAACDRQLAQLGVHIDAGEVGPTWANPALAQTLAGVGSRVVLPEDETPDDEDAYDGEPLEEYELAVATPASVV